MQQRPENFKAADEDPETTLVTPRFDAEEARRAHPVVPLAEAPPRTARLRAPRRSWTHALLAVALLAVAALGGAVATQYMQGSRVERAQEAEPVQEQTQQAQEPTQAAPVRTAEAPPPPPPSMTAEATREDAPASQPEPREARTRRARAAVVAADSARDGAENYGDEEPRNKKAEKRREREREREREDEDEVEKAAREVLKRAKKGKAPRLVDVLTSSP